jgi:SPP1 gp7 family putative phage head morphogenesis protein
MRYDLRALTRRSNPGIRRKTIVFRPIVAPGVLATDLYRAAYAPVIAAWTSALEPIMSAYERTLAQLTQDSPADVGAVVATSEGGVAALLITLRLRLEEWAARIERWQRGKWRSAVLIATKVDVETLIGAGDMRAPMSAAVERNVSLVKSVSEQARGRIADSVFRGLQNRTPARDVAKEIREAVDMSRRRALNIAADQTVKLTSALNDERRREAGLMAWQWEHSDKLRPRPEHVARDGKRYSDDPADGAPPPNDRPGELPFCGCTSRAVLSLDGEF